MLFDDRLATVLRQPARSEAGARTQYRQLLDLLGSLPETHDGPLAEAAYDRLAELASELPPTVQSAILRAPGLRLRNRALVAFLAAGEPQAAAAALATASLSESDWLYLIPRLSLTARGFLRHRRNLPFSARQVLDRLGVRDLVLPEPSAPNAGLAAEAPEGPPAAETAAGIGALVRRIEAFQRARREGATTPRLPLGEMRVPDTLAPSRAFDFSTRADGTIDWADPAMAPLVVGMLLGVERPGAVAVLDPASARAIDRRLPVRGGRAELNGPPDIAGAWRIDAFPVFSSESGHFAGYHGRMRRKAPRVAAPARDGGTGDKLRQLLHELRTPVSAIQGFAELIQQQLFGPAPNEYRALAAAVAVDAARILAGFDEIDRLARLEGGTFEREPGESDLRDIVARIQRRLESVLRQRSARIDLAASGSPFTVELAEPDALQLVWRLLATLAGSLAPGEIVELSLAGGGNAVVLDMDLPAALMGDEDPFASVAPQQPRAISAGMFGTGFALRLARAEAGAAGGTLERHDDRLRLTLPALTGAAAPHTVGNGDSGAGSAT